MNRVIAREYVEKNYVHKDRIRELIRKLDVDIERNNKRKIQHTIDDTSEMWSSMMITYSPETIKRVLKELLEDR